MSAERILLPVEGEFIENLRAAVGVGEFAELKRQLIPFALEILWLSLLGGAHPKETLHGITALQYENLLENPDRPSPIHDALNALERDPNLQPRLSVLHEEIQRLRLEWLHEMTVGRFERTVPYLHNEDALLHGWQKACADWKESSINPYEAARQESERILAIWGATFSESAKRLFLVSFLAACRKLFVHFCEARETWVGACSDEEFELDAALAARLGLDRSTDARARHRLVLRFGLVDHVWYVPPPLEKLQLFVEAIHQTGLIGAIQQKLCPFVTQTGNCNLPAEVFYKVYQPQRLRELQGFSPPAPHPAWLARTGWTAAEIEQFGFVPLDQETIGDFTRIINALPRLRAFLFNPRTEAGLIRQRLFMGVLEPLLAQVTEETLLSLCRQWNPLVRTASGEIKPLLSCAEEQADRLVGKVQAADSPAAQQQTEAARHQVVREELLHVLMANTAQWQRALESEGLVSDPGRDYFMTILDKAIDEGGERQRARYRDACRVACVVVE